MAPDLHSRTETMFQSGIGLAEKFLSQVTSVAASDPEEFAYKGAMLFFFCKAYKSFQATHRLWREGFEEDALILVRTIFELALQSRYMHEDPKPRARLFTEHDPVVRYRYYLKLKELSDRKMLGSIQVPESDLQEMQGYYEKLKDRYPEYRGWWGDSIGWLARHFGKETEVRYVAIYWMQSSFVHSGVTSVRKYLGDEKTGLKIRCYPNHSDEIMVPQEATLWFIDVMKHASDALGVSMDADLEQTLKTCWPTPKEGPQAASSE